MSEILVFCFTGALLNVSAGLVSGLELFRMSPAPDNTMLFNVGKNANSLKTYRSFTSSLNFDFSLLILSPKLRNLPCLNPITQNIAAEGLLDGLKKI
jgi:hypothetical protein